MQYFDTLVNQNVCSHYTDFLSSSAATSKLEQSLTCAAYPNTEKGRGKYKSQSYVLHALNSLCKKVPTSPNFTKEIVMSCLNDKYPGLDQIGSLLYYDGGHEQVGMLLNNFIKRNLMIFIFRGGHDKLSLSALRLSGEFWAGTS